ncbi:MAG: NAD(+) diphosphatase [Rhodospirillales bacterium]
MDNTTQPSAARRITYAGHAFDRAAEKRGDKAWLAQQMAHSDAVVLPVWRDNNLIDESTEPDGMPALRAVGGDEAQALLASSDPVLLGLDGDRPWFACDLSALDLADARDAVGDDGEDTSFIDLRRVGPILPHDEGALLAYARGMAFWQRRNRFCGICGSPTSSESAGHVRRCNDTDCAQPHFPRSDPAVIMLVTDEGANGPRCLLGRQPSWPEGLYSSLAGFVEPGESLEDAVAREVWEESRIKVCDVRYRASQPWPFPSSLMLGFRARALTTNIDTTEDELDDARWFDRAEILELYSTGASDGKLSRADSIARWLIEDWLSETA